MAYCIELGLNLAQGDFSSVPILLFIFFLLLRSLYFRSFGDLILGVTERLSLFSADFLKRQQA